MIGQVIYYNCISVHHNYKVSLCILQITLRFVRELCIFSHEYSRKPKKLHNIN